MNASIIYDKCSHEQFLVKMPGVKRGRQSFTFEYKLLQMKLETEQQQ